MSGGRYRAYREYKSSGVEFLGKVPTHWEVFQLKRSVESCVNGIWGTEPKNDGKDTIVLRVADFDRATLSLKPDGYTLRNIEEKEKERRVLRPGDLLLEKSGGGEKTLVGQVVLFDKPFEAVTSNFVAKLTPLQKFNSRFLNYTFSRFYDARINFCSIKQNTGIQNLDSDAYLCEKFCSPPLPEQTQIAKFLDHETAKIDRLIEKQEALIALLKEKRQAVISHAVTKGLNPHAPLKDSGIEWLGKVPAAWEVTRIGRLCEFISYGFTNPMPSTDAGPFMLTANDIDFQRIKYEDARHTDEVAFTTKLSDKSRPKTGDVLLTKDGTLGRVAVFDGQDRACISQSIALLRIDRNYVSPHFLSVALSGSKYQSRMSFDAGGTTIKHIYISILAKMAFALPDLRTQEAVLKGLGEKLKRVDDLIARAKAAAALLNERRTALISAAVTGKIDVRHWQPSEEVLAAS